MRKIINECYDNAKKILKENMNLLELIANALLENETLTKEQIDYLAENGKMPDEDLVVEEKEEKPKKETKKKRQIMLTTNSKYLFTCYFIIE